MTMKLKKILAMSVSALLMSAVSAVTAFADASADLKIEQPKKKGDTFSVTVTVDADEDIGYMQSQLSYDERAIEFVSGDAVGGGGLINLQGFPEMAGEPIELKLEFKLLDERGTDISMVNSLVFSVDGIVIGEPEDTETVSATEAADVFAEIGDSKSSEDDTSEDESLEDITIEIPNEEESSSEAESSQDEESGDDISSSGVLMMIVSDVGELEPEFSPDIIDYTIYVDNSVEYVELTAVAASPDDEVNISGESWCEVGENVREITVVGADGSNSRYTVTIIRADAQESLDEESSEDESIESSSSVVRRDNTEPDKYKRILNPALAIVLVVLVVALVIIIMWIRSSMKKDKARRRKRK